YHSTICSALLPEQDIKGRPQHRSRADRDSGLPGGALTPDPRDELDSHGGRHRWRTGHDGQVTLEYCVVLRLSSKLRPDFNAHSISSCAGIPEVPHSKK